MKSLFTLLLAVGSLTTVFAQYKNDRYGKNDNNEKRDYAYNDRRYSETFSMSYKEKEFQVQKINREYNFKINSVSRNRYLWPRERSSQIRRLERQRQDEIRNIEARFNDRRNRFNDGHSNRW